MFTVDIKYRSKWWTIEQVIENIEHRAKESGLCIASRTKGSNRDGSVQWRFRVPWRFGAVETTLMPQEQKIIVAIKHLRGGRLERAFRRFSADLGGSLVMIGAMQES